VTSSSGIWWSGSEKTCFSAGAGPLTAYKALETFHNVGTITRSNDDLKQYGLLISG